MEFYTIASSSAGNCSLVRVGGDSFLIDAGISARRILQALAALKLEIEELRGIFITHEHEDHVKGLATLLKKYNLPVYGSRGTIRALQQSGLPAFSLHSFSSGDALDFESCVIRSFPISHDAADPCGYRIDTQNASLGFLTDTGYVTEEARTALLGVDTLLLEANHDLDRLQNGPYPYFLKRRILGDEGHLSNAAAAEFALASVKAGTEDILLAHLSKDNNTPALAEYTVGRILQSCGKSVRLCVAPRDQISEVHLCRKSRFYASEN